MSWMACLTGSQFPLAQGQLGQHSQGRLVFTVLEAGRVHGARNRERCMSAQACQVMFGRLREYHRPPAKEALQRLAASETWPMLHSTSSANPAASSSRKAPAFALQRMRGGRLA
jgi:hypothetical protein